MNQLTIELDEYSKVINNNSRIFDNESKLIEQGMILNKLNNKRKKFEEVFYKLDLVNFQLVASTKEFGRKQKYCKNDIKN